MQQVLLSFQMLCSCHPGFHLGTCQVLRAVIYLEPTIYQGKLLLVVLDVLVAIHTAVSCCRIGTLKFSPLGQGQALSSYMA